MCCNFRDGEMTSLPPKQKIFCCKWISKSWNSSLILIGCKYISRMDFKEKV